MATKADPSWTAGGGRRTEAPSDTAARLMAQLSDRGSGWCVAVLGQPGAGKTTLLRAAARVRWPGPGRVSPVLVAPDGPGWRSAAGWAGADALRRAGLGHLAPRRLGTLAMGARCAVTLARAMRDGAPALLLSEPSPALLALARRSGLPVLFTTEQPAVALTADHLVLLRPGHPPREGAPVELYDDPQSPSVAALLGSANVLRGTVREVYPTGFAWTANAQRFRQATLPGLERPPLGREVLLLLWPERIVPTTAEEAGDNMVVGTAITSRFVGSRPVLDLDTGLGRLVSALGPYAPPVPGSAVRVGWSAGAATLLRDDP